MIQLLDTSASQLQKTAESYIGKAEDLLKDIVASKGQQPLTGWFDFPEREGFALAKDILHFKSQFEPYYDAVCVLGIGGSYLGCRGIYNALSHTHEHIVSPDKTTLLFGGYHLAESELLDLLDALAAKEPIINIISKSGGTLEPAITFRIIKKALEQRYGLDEARRRILATTDANSGALLKIAQRHQYAKFVVPESMGGRFSVLSAVGLLPLAMADLPIEEILQGAHDTFAALKGQKKEMITPILWYAAYRRAAAAEGKHIEILSYHEPRLQMLTGWWQQLFGESEGKHEKGLFPQSLCYTTDLHAMGQWMQEGPKHVLETFLEWEIPQNHKQILIERRLAVPLDPLNDDKLNDIAGLYLDDINLTAMSATRLAHASDQVPCLNLKVKCLDPYHIGAFIAYMETVCAISAKLLEVNPYDQPGVEKYKKNLNQALKRSLD